MCSKIINIDAGVPGHPDINADWIKTPRARRLHDWRTEHKVSVPEGRAGDWAVERFTVDEEEAAPGAPGARLQAALHGGRGHVPAGTYTRLMYRGEPVMSDTPDEIGDHLGFIYAAKGAVLINGLGLGLALQAVARKAEVTAVTVVEIDADVIRLVWPHYQARFGDKITLVQGDAFVYTPAPGERFDAAWHDIWCENTSDNLAEMARLKRKYARRCDWQGCWGEMECRRLKRMGV